MIYGSDGPLTNMSLFVYKDILYDLIFSFRILQIHMFEKCVCLVTFLQKRILNESTNL